MYGTQYFNFGFCHIFKSASSKARQEGRTNDSVRSLAARYSDGLRCSDVGLSPLITSSNFIQC